MATKTITSSMTMAQINTALKNNREVIFKAGTYTISKCMTLYSNSKVICEDGVVFKRNCTGRMLQTEVVGTVTKYNGTHDSSWTGGKFIANTNSNAANVIVLFHANNITLSNISIDGCVGLHSLEINSSKSVKVKKCTFTNQTSKPKEEFREAIQIDYANKDGLSFSGIAGSSACYDGTYCNDITISNCTFNNVPNGIGTHAVSEKEDYASGITISNCTFTNVKYFNIRFVGFKDTTIKNCGNTKIKLSKLTTGHKLAGGKVSIPERGNKNITIDGITIA